MMNIHKQEYIGPERRGGKRTKGIAVIYSTDRQEDLKAVGFTENIGTKGIYLNVAKELNENSILFLKMNLPHSHTPIQFKGRVVWVKQINKRLRPERAGYELGIEFIEISEDDHNKVIKFVLDSLKEDNS